jgi:hypothetical protein
VGKEDAIGPGKKGEEMSRHAQIEYEPDGDVLCDFHEDNSFVRILLGPLGSAKTTACVMEIYLRACAQKPAADGIRYTRWLCLRSTYPELETTTIKSWYGIFGEEFGRFTWGHPPRHHMKFGLSDGTKVDAEVIFLALDGPNAEDALRGMELTGVWPNEINEIRKPILDMARGRIGRYPGMKDGGPTWYGMFGDTNMPDEDHWVYKLAEESNPQGWRFFRQPGGVIKIGDDWVVNPRAENLHNLPDGYYMNQLGGNSEDWIRVYLAAEYGFVRDGRPVYGEYMDSVHCREVEGIEHLPIEIGADFGLTPAAVVGQEAPNGQIRWLDELVMEDAGAVRFAEALTEKLNRDWSGYKISNMTGDPSGNTRAETDEDTVFNVMSANGHDFVPAETNVFTPRREAVAVPLSRLIDGEPGLILSPRCKQLRKAMAGGYAFRRMRIAGEERFTDKPDKNHYSHIAEAGQYLNLGFGKGRMIIQRTDAHRKKYAHYGQKPQMDRSDRRDF